jgi:hypothetical protein
MTRQTRSRSAKTQTELDKSTREDMSTGTTKVVRNIASTAKKRAAGGAASATLSASFQEVKPHAKKRKPGNIAATQASNTPPVENESVAAPARRQSNHEPSAYTPTLLPPTLSFSLLEAISHLTLHDPRFGNFFTHVPCKPFQSPLEAIDPFKTLVTSIIGQQVSWMAARAITKRFRELFGFDDEDGFPSPNDVAKEEVLRLKGVGLSTRKAEYGTSRVILVARQVAHPSHLLGAALRRGEVVNRAFARWDRRRG